MTAIDFSVPFALSKHFRNTWMRKWACDVSELRMACYSAKKIIPLGNKGKYEIFTSLHERKIKLIISNYYEKEIYVITGAEGHD